MLTSTLTYVVDVGCYSPSRTALRSAALPKFAIPAPAAWDAIDRIPSSLVRRMTRCILWLGEGPGTREAGRLGFGAGARTEPAVRESASLGIPRVLVSCLRRALASFEPDRGTNRNAIPAAVTFEFLRTPNTTFTPSHHPGHCKETDGTDHTPPRPPTAADRERATTRCMSHRLIPPATAARMDGRCLTRPRTTRESDLPGFRGLLPIGRLCVAIHAHGSRCGCGKITTAYLWRAVASCRWETGVLLFCYGPCLSHLIAHEAGWFCFLHRLLLVPPRCPARTFDSEATSWVDKPREDARHICLPAGEKGAWLCIDGCPRFACPPSLTHTTCKAVWRRSVVGV